jgi:hypothetical protein
VKENYPPPPVKRRNEFIQEKRIKGKVQADFVIYISPEIIIPVEVEKLGNIKAGEEQLITYQKGLEKKYGILTDGQTWRFYNNDIIDNEFQIDRIFATPDLFLTFWNEHIKPINYYSVFFKKDTEQLPIEKHQATFFEDTTFLIKNFKNKLQIEGYFGGLANKEKNKESTQMAYSYLIQFILYKSLVDNEFDDFLKEYKTNLLLISNYIKEEKYRDIFGIIEGISERISKNIYRPFKAEQNLIDEKIRSIYHKPKLELQDISPWLDIFIYIKKYSFRNTQNEIFGFIYENYLKELFSDEERGQYFTDPSVVNFMIKQIGYTKETIKEKLNTRQEDKLSIIDPACGSGTFLYTACDSLVHAVSGNQNNSKLVQDLVSNNVFGLDIEEFPLYLAEMSILMRLLPLIINEKYNNPFEKKVKLFLTKDSIAEFLDTNIKIDTAQQSLFPFQEPTYKSFMRNTDDIRELKQSLTSHLKVPRRRFDYVIANPPYIGYNACSKQGLESFKLIKRGKLRLNNIYGVNLHSVPGNPKRYRPNPNLWAFFIALGIGLLKDGGKLCFIIPQTVLVNSDFDVIRYHLAKFTSIQKIITFQAKLFFGRGLSQKKEVPTSSLIFITINKVPAKKHMVEIINYSGEGRSIEDILSTKEPKTEQVANEELLENIQGWNFLKVNTKTRNLMKNYKEHSADISEYYTHKVAETKFGNRFIFDGGYSIDEKQVLSSPNLSNYSYYRFPKLKDSFWTIVEEEGYWPNVRNGPSKLFIDLRQGNQGYEFLDSQYKLIWSYNNTTRFFFTDKPVIWARNKYLGIGSNNKEELVYLFAILNSELTSFILRNFVKIEQEDTRTILVSLQTIKDLIRVPIITEENKKYKEQVTKLATQMLDLESKKLCDFVDFSKIMLQKFDSVEVKGTHILLKKDNENIRLEIQKNQLLIQSILNNPNFLKEISLPELKDTPIIDYEKQIKLKELIDELIYKLYKLK